MKKFKPFSLLILILMMFIIFVPRFNVTGTNSDEPNTDESNQYIDTRNYDLYQIDDVETLSTFELLEEVKNYPYLLDLLLYNDYEYGLKAVSSKYNGLKELLKRDDLDNFISNHSFNNLNLRERVLLSYLLYESSPTYTYNPIYTILNNEVDAYRCIEDFVPDDISLMNNIYDSNYTDAERLRDATGRYNCHSYAWYNQSATNNIWLPHPGDFKTDCYYQQNTWHAGDILVYNDGTKDIHSAIIESTDGTLNGTIVISKWGSAGLYRHAANYSPYFTTTTYTAYKLCINHLFVPSLYNSIMHQQICSNCSYDYLEPHVFTVLPNNLVTHQQICITCSYSYYESHTLNPATGRCYVCGDRCVIIEPNFDNHNIE